MTTEEKVKWFDTAIRFQLDGTIHMVMKSRVNGEGAWAIVDSKNNTVLNSNLEWEEELILGKRDEAYLIRTRFQLDSAIVMFEQYKMFAE